MSAFHAGMAWGAAAATIICAVLWLGRYALADRTGRRPASGQAAYEAYTAAYEATGDSRCLPWGSLLSATQDGWQAAADAAVEAAR